MGVRIPDGYGLGRLMWTCSGDAEPIMCTWGYQIGGSEDPNASAQFLGGAMTGANRPAEANLMGTAWTFIGCSVTENRGLGPISGLFTTSVVGIGATQALSNNCAYIIRKHTILGGRQGRGRIFAPPTSLTNGNVDEAGFITSGVRTDLLNRWTNWMDAVNTGLGVQLALLHDSATPPTEITSLSIDQKIGTQRTRMRR